MAKNWTLKEAVAVITTGTNKEAMAELCKRFPMTTLAIAKIGKNEGVETLMGYMPEHVTMLKLERAAKEGIEDSDVEADEDAEVTEAVEEASEEQDLSAMTSKQLYELCTKRGIKAKKYGVNKQYYLGLLQNSDAEEEEEEEDEEVEDAVDYSTMKAPELYSLCKKRGIKVEARQKAAVYIKALEAADASVEEAEEADDDWDEEEPINKPAKKEAKKAPAKKESKKEAPAKKESKKAAADDDDDWDI